MRSRGVEPGPGGPGLPTAAAPLLLLLDRRSLGGGRLLGRGRWRVLQGVQRLIHVSFFCLLCLAVGRHERGADLGSRCLLARRRRRILHGAQRHLPPSLDDQAETEEEMKGSHDSPACPRPWAPP